MSKSLDEANLISYILGELTEAEQLELEEELFTNTDSFQQLQILKEQLMDDYAQKRLSPQHRKLFEQKFLASPWRRERVVFAQALAEHIENSSAATLKESAEQQRRVIIGTWLGRFYSFFNFQQAAWRYAAAIFLLLMIGVIGLFIENPRLRSKLAKAVKQPLAKPTSPNSSLTAELAKERSRMEALQRKLAQGSQATNLLPNQIKDPQEENDSPLVNLSFILHPQSLMSKEESQQIEIANETKQVTLLLYLKTDNKIETFRTQLIKSGWTKVWQSQLKVELEGETKVVRVVLKASLLAEQPDYNIKLSSVNADGTTTDIEEYPFSVVIK